VETIEGA
ncbi:hypothetical protein THAOC_21212, partial [Thalassiosira oceanica]